MSLSPAARVLSALAGLSALALCVAGGAGAAPAITCTNSVSDQAIVQTAIDGGGIVSLKGTCLGSWVVTAPVALVGSGGATLDGSFAGSVLTIANGATAALHSLTIRNGESAFGGGLFADSGTTVIVRNSTITSNTATQAGGGIYAQGSAFVNVSGGAIVHNEAGEAGGGIATFGAELSVSGTNISSNLSTMGGGIAAQFSNASLSRARITGNTAIGYAGGIASFASGSVEEDVAPTTSGRSGLPFSRPMPHAPREAAQETAPNVSLLPAGFTIDSSAIDHNTALLQGGGGIVNVSPGASTKLTIRDTSISLNVVAGAQGVIGAGGVANVGGSPGDTATLDISGSKIVGNDAGGGAGGGVYNVSQGGGALLVISSTAISSSRGLVDPNRAAFGGGIFQDATLGPASVTLGKGTGVVHNLATSDGGGIYNVCVGTITFAGGGVALNTPNNVVQAGCAG